MGEAYLLIASLYASSANSCGSSEFEKRMVYVAALDMAKTAAAVDPLIERELKSISRVTRLLRQIKKQSLLKDWNLEALIKLDVG